MHLIQSWLSIWIWHCMPFSWTSPWSYCVQLDKRISQWLSDQDWKFDCSSMAAERQCELLSMVWVQKKIVFELMCFSILHIDKALSSSKVQGSGFNKKKLHLVGWKLQWRKRLVCFCFKGHTQIPLSEIANLLLCLSFSLLELLLVDEMNWLWNKTIFILLGVLQ